MTNIGMCHLNMDGLYDHFARAISTHVCRSFTAVYGFTPFGAKQNLFNYVVYFSCAFGITFDSVTGNPKRVSRKFFLNRVKTLGRDFVIVSFIISILKQYDYAFFDTTHKAHSMEHSLQELFSWQHLLNNFLVAREYTMNTFSLHL